MMWRARLPLVLGAGAAALAACGHSPPTRFFTLDPTPAVRPPPPGPIAPVQLDAVRIPAVLDRPELVSQAGPVRLKVDDLDHWGAPLGELMRRTLAQDLLARLPAGAFAPPDAPAPPGARGLVVTVVQLRAGGDGRARLVAHWALLDAASHRPVMAGDVRLEAAGGGAGASGEAEAISRLLGQLADQIAAAVAA